ncbi:exonuclease V isoform X2 [Tachysurus fulvidraco]|uniref:exonuclease V isoform X2 n=1 Tax=Tachysurus fulvidraco TaxID=1234273 RepID=UPI001FEEF2CC|nr:exonuclease V isoform X2 [Tachysurus fulvidraco]
MEQEGDWGNISDSELLDIQSEHFCIEESSEATSSSATSGDPAITSSITFPTSLPNTREQLKQGPVKRNEETGAKRKRDAEDSLIPSLRFRKLHLSVSLLCEQTWCEKKVVYGILKPQIREKDKQRIEVQNGSSIHLARELEVHDVVPINIQTREDAVAITLINMLNMIPILETGQCVREFPVFGVVEGVYFKGIIDELSYNQKGELVLKELKTRRHDSLPGAAQALGHRFQVGMYKLLFDALVRGEVKKEQILEHLKLKASLALGTDVITHAADVQVNVATFDELLDAFILTLSCSDLPCVDVLQLEYCHQSSSSFIGTMSVQFDEAQMRADLRGYLEYWKGQREPKGVDIEDAWKCTYCVYEEICDWKKNRSLVHDQSLHTRKRVNMN